MFIAKNNNLIVLAKDTLEELKEGLKNMNYTSIEETETEYEIHEGSFLTKEEIVKSEQEKINHLTCTALDLATFIKQAGLTDAEVLQFLNANPSLQLQLTLCKDVYCGVVRQLCPLKITETLTLTDDMVVQFFKKKHNIK